MGSVIFVFLWNHWCIFISELIQLIDPCIVIIAVKSFLLIDLLKSIGSSEPTYVSRNDDWFKTIPNLVMLNVSITFILICLAMRQVFTWCIILSLPGYIMVVHRKLILLSHIMCSTLAFYGFSISPGSTSDSSVQNVYHQVVQMSTQEEGWSIGGW